MFADTTPHAFPIILLAEDNDAQRSRIARILRAHGCGVLEARTSVEALLLGVEFAGTIDALLTAVELRRYSNGRELAGCLKTARPDMRVVYLAVEEVEDEETQLEILRGDAIGMLTPPSASTLSDFAASLAAARNQSLAA